MQPLPPSIDGFWSRSAGSNGSGHSPQLNMQICGNAFLQDKRWNLEELLPVAASFSILFVYQQLF
jgi:hypothetical protein